MVIIDLIDQEGVQVARFVNLRECRIEFVATSTIITSWAGVINLEEAQIVDYYYVYPLSRCEGT